MMSKSATICIRNLKYCAYFAKDFNFHHILVKISSLNEQELNITPKPTKNKTKEALKATQAKGGKDAKEA